MATEATPKKNRRGRVAVDPNVPLILVAARSRTWTKKRVCCEAPDAVTYQQYVEYVLETQPMPNQLSQEEIEARFNAMAWAGVWSRDPGFRLWQQSRARG